MKGKTKTILTVVIAILVFSIAAVGTVTFLKDDGEASAAEEGTMNVLPVTGSDGEETVYNEEQNQGEGLEGDEVTEEQPEQGENVDEDFDDEVTNGEDEITTGSQLTGEEEQLEPEATTIEQERLVSTTLNWSGISLNSTIGETGINYTKLAYTVKYYQVVSKDEIKLLNTETGIAEYGTTVTVSEEQIKENCPETGYKFDENSNISVVITENVNGNVIEVYYIKDRFDLKVEYEYENGEAAADAFEKDYEYEEEYSVESPKIEGYTPDKEIVEGQMPGEDTTITVVYKSNTDVSYIVKYLEKETNKALADEEIRTEKTFNETYTEIAKTVTGYTVDETEKTITLDAYGKEVIFYYTVNEYTATFIPNNGEENIEKTQKYGTELTAPEDPVKEGYTFVGWDKEVPETMPAEDTTYIAQWEKNEYTVKYEVDGEQFGEVETYYFGDGLTQREEPAKEGYTFSGWDITLPETMPAQNLVVKGNFTINSYTVKYYVDGEQYGEVETYNYGEELTQREEPTKEGYTFSGWDVTLPQTMPAKDIEVKGIFTINQYSYKIEYYYSNVLDESKTVSSKADFGTVIDSYEDKLIDGYVFEKVENKPLTISTNVEENVIKVYYVRNEFEYTIEYYYDNIKDDSKTENKTALFGDVIDSYTNKNKEGYRFDKTENKPLTITSNTENNVMKVYYVKAYITYTVEYYKDGEKAPFATSNDLTALFGSAITNVDTETNKPDGYELEKIENLPLTISAVAANNVIKVYYAKPNISIEKTASKATANVGDDITYTLTLTNSGKVAGTATVTDTLPEGLTYKSSNNNGAYENGVITWASVIVPANGTTTLTVIATVNANKIGAILTNTGTLSDDTPTSTPEQKTDTATTTINEITATEIGATQGEYGKDSVNVVLVMDLSSSMNELVYTFHECTHEHEYRDTYWGTQEYCPENCEEQRNGTWGYYTSETRLSIAKRAAQNFVNKIYTDADSKVTVTVVTFNNKTGNSKYVGTKVLTFGTNNKTATNANYSGLVTEIGNIDIGTATSGYGTHIKAALDTTYTTIYGTNGLSSTYPNNSNVVIFLGDGDPTGTSYSGFGDNTETNINTSATTIKNAGATIYSIGFGSDATNTSSAAYRVLKNMSSNNTVYTANDSVALAEVFTNLEGQLQPDKPATTNGGIITITLTKNLVVNGTNPIVVEYNGTQLFACTGTAEEPLSKYNLTYNAETKTLTFDINAYNANSANTTKITNNNVTIRYFIER